MTRSDPDRAVAADSRANLPSVAAIMTTSTATPATYFRDGLHSIFAYLTPKETSRASSACRHWAVAVATEPPKSHISYRCRTHSQLAHFLRSTFAQRHTSRLSFFPRGDKAKQGLSRWHIAQLTSPTLTHLAAFCAPDSPSEDGVDNNASGTALSAGSREAARPPEAMKLPAHLRSAHLSTGYLKDPFAHSANSSEVNWLYRSVATAPVCLTKLTMTDAHVRWAEVDIAPLLALRTSLRSLTISSEWGNDAFTSTHIDVLKQLGALTELRAFHGEWCRTRVAHLVAAPSPLAESLETFELRLGPYCVLSPAEEPLFRLSRLRSLGFDAVRIGSVGQLTLLVRLLPSTLRGFIFHVVNLGWRQHFESTEGRIFPDGAVLPHVTSFTYEGSNWNPLALSPIVSHGLATSLPNLRRLVLIGVSLESLAFLAILPLLATLDFGVHFLLAPASDGQRLVSSDSHRDQANGRVWIDALLDDLRGASALRRLTLRACSGRGLDQPEIHRFVASLVVPSTVVPQLHKFVDARPFHEK